MKIQKMGKKLMSLLLTSIMLLTMQGIPVHAEIAGQQTKSKETPTNPVHHCTGKNDGTDYTDWNYIYFGSYPQTEVTGTALTSAITGASYDSNGDTWIDGTKYRRISKSDTHSSDYFGNSAYRYFKWEQIKWRVLQNDGSTLFVLADKGLDCKSYNEKYTSITWENCTLRDWLNSFFYNMAFSDEEKRAVVEKTLINDDNPKYGSDGGNKTNDKIYLLSLGEITESAYGFCNDFNTDSVSRRVQASDYAHIRGAGVNSGEYAGNCWWWLRSPGFGSGSATYVIGAGYVSTEGDDVCDSLDADAVVPALHINLSSELWSMTDDGNSGNGGESSTDDIITDYESDITSLMTNKGTLNVIKYLCTDSNFTNSIYVHENDGTFASNITMILSDVYYRGMDGWKDLFTAATSKEEAKKILAALLQGYQSDVEELAMAKNAKKYAGYFVSGLKDYIKLDSITSSVDNQDIKKLSNIITEQKVEELLINGEYGKLSKEFQKLGGYSQDSKIVKTLEGYMSSKNLADTLSKGLKFMEDGLTIISMTQDTFNYLYQLESLMDADDIYSEMLLYLKDNCCYDVVKDAARELYNVIHGTYIKQLGYVTTALKDAVIDKAFDLVVDKAVAALPYGEIIKAGFDWGVNLSNLVFHTGDTQKLKDNMRTVAYIGQCLSLWTLDNQLKFLTSADSERNEYARKLYYSMYMLWNTRKVGEETLQNMFTKSYEKWSKYYTLSLQIYSTLESYKDSIFTDSMKEALMTVTVSCPVDVEVYDAKGRLVLTAKDGKEDKGCVGNVYYYVKYQKLDDDYIKIICFPDNSGYTLKSIGKKLGTVDSMITSINEQGIADRRYFENVAVKKDTVITIDSVSSDSDNYTITDSLNGDSKTGIFKSEPDSFIPVTKMVLSDSKLNLKVGDSQLLTATLFPDNATEKKVLWTSSDESVATVNSDGVVTAVAAGNATILCTSLNDAKKTVSCEVNVSSKIACKHTYETFVTKATTVKNGRITETCTVCGEIKSSNTILAVKSAKLRTTSYTYNGKARKPSVIVKDSSGKAISNSNYSVAYKNNEKVGKATVTIKLKDNYKGTLTKTFTIYPKGTTVSGKIAAKSKGLTVTWKKQPKSTTGYQIQISTNKKFAKKATTTKTVKNNSATKLTVRKLKSKEKYYVRIRTYKVVKEKKYCSSWSRTKTVTTKK